MALSTDGHPYQNLFYAQDGLINYDNSLNPFFRINGFINVANNAAQPPPEHLTDDLQKAFKEGAACLAIGSYNAAAAMFRLCIDLVTRPLLPDPDAEGPQPNSRTRRDLGLRLPWLFDNGKLPLELRDLAACIREDGNDGAHVGNLGRVDAEDVMDFTIALLERLITEPKRLELAQARREDRRRPAR